MAFRIDVPQALSLLLAAVLASVAVAAPPPAAQVEIEHLLVYVERSGCEFYRNGSWHGAAEARTHLGEKYAYAVARDYVGSAEEFIVRVGTGSSPSGKPYDVRCAGGVPVPTAQWLVKELAPYRKG